VRCSRAVPAIEHRGWSDAHDARSRAICASDDTSPTIGAPIHSVDDLGGDPDQPPHGQRQAVPHRRAARAACALRHCEAEGIQSDPPEGLPSSPLPLRPEATGFRRAAEAVT
jgi:hypothetical protein